MPLVDIQLIEGVFDQNQKQEMIRKVTDAMVAIEGEPMRGVTWVEVPRGAERAMVDRRQVAHRCRREDYAREVSRGARRPPPTAGRPISAGANLARKNAPES